MRAAVVVVSLFAAAVVAAPVDGRGESGRAARKPNILFLGSIWITGDPAETITSGPT